MKRTKKYVAAEAIALEIGVPINDDIYQNLQENNYFWDSDLGEWIPRGENPTSNEIEIRICSDSKKVSEDCDRIIQILSKQGLTLEDKSQPYICRPPKQLKSRIYLTFSRN